MKTNDIPSDVPYSCFSLGERSLTIIQNPLNVEIRIKLMVGEIAAQFTDPSELRCIGQYLFESANNLLARKETK